MNTHSMHIKTQTHTHAHVESTSFMRVSWLCVYVNHTSHRHAPKNKLIDIHARDVESRDFNKRTRSPKNPYTEMVDRCDTISCLSIAISFSLRHLSLHISHEHTPFKAGKICNRFARICKKGDDNSLSLSGEKFRVINYY